MPDSAVFVDSAFKSCPAWGVLDLGMALIIDARSTSALSNR